MAKKILVIDDQPEFVKMIAIRLKANGYQVITAKDGQEGVNKIQSEMPDLVVSDLAMPYITGNVLVRIVKQSEKFKHIPVIILSAFVQEKMKNGVEVPADLYLPKPFKAEELLQAIQKLLAASAGA